MISIKDLGGPASSELSAIECFLLDFSMEKYNKVAIFIIVDAEKQLEAGRIFPGILIKQIRDTNYYSVSIIL